MQQTSVMQPSRRRMLPRPTAMYPALRVNASNSHVGLVLLQCMILDQTLNETSHARKLSAASEVVEEGVLQSATLARQV